MDKTGITLMGLGPGEADLLTRQAWEVLQTTPEIYVRTRLHPALGGIPETLQVFSFDDVYEKNQFFEEVYAQIVEKVLALGRRPQGVVYAVPGHPFIAEATPREIARRARLEGIPVRVVEGLSFLEATFGVLGEDPLPHTALVDALELVRAHVPPFPADAPALIAQVYSRQVASDVKLTLMEVYPDEHPVRLVHAAGTPEAQVEDLPLYEIDRSHKVGLQTTLYLPPLEAGSHMVRRMVSVQVEIGQGKTFVENLLHYLQPQDWKEEEGPVYVQGLAPPNGLVLAQVSYLPAKMSAQQPGD